MGALSETENDDKKNFTKVRHIVNHYLIFYLAKNGDDPIKFRPPTDE